MMIQYIVWNSLGDASIQSKTITPGNGYFNVPGGSETYNKNKNIFDLIPLVSGVAVILVFRKHLNI